MERTKDKVHNYVLIKGNIKVLESVYGALQLLNMRTHRTTFVEFA